MYFKNFYTDCKLRAELAYCSLHLCESKQFQSIKRPNWDFLRVWDIVSYMNLSPLDVLMWNLKKLIFFNIKYK